MYKIKVTKTGVGWKVLLLKKCWFFWLPNTVSHISQGYEYLVDKQINEWMEHFNISVEFISIPKSNDNSKADC